MIAVFVGGEHGIEVGGRPVCLTLDMEGRMESFGD